MHDLIRTLFGVDSLYVGIPIRYNYMTQTDRQRQRDKGRETEAGIQRQRERHTGRNKEREYTMHLSTAQRSSKRGLVLLTRSICVHG